MVENITRAAKISYLEEWSRYCVLVELGGVLVERSEKDEGGQLRAASCGGGGVAQYPPFPLYIGSF